MHGLILNEAFDLINAKQRDELERIASMWGAYLGQPISCRDAACMMALLTLAREARTHMADDLVDVAGYIGLAGEFALREAAVRAEAAADGLENCGWVNIRDWGI